jgi:hypothetical protein
LLLQAIEIGSTVFTTIWIVKQAVSRTLRGPTPKAVNENLEPNVYKFQSFKDWNCPKCGSGWCSTCPPKYCECEEHHTGHFHMECNGTIGEKADQGCHYKWFMISKDREK